MMQTRLKVHWAVILAGLLVPLASPLTRATFGEEFRLQIPQLSGACAYGQWRGPVPFDLGSCLSTVAAIRVEVAGTYSMGWWDGDDVEDFYHGPMGSSLFFQMNHDAGLVRSWYASADLGTNGLFNQTITLRPGAHASWDFLRDGTADLSLEHSGFMGWGHMTVPPQATISSVTVAIEAERLLRMVSFSRDGALCWTPMPTQGVIRVHFAPEVTGSWSIVATNASSNTCYNVTFPPGGNAGFYRIVYSNN